MVSKKITVEDVLFAASSYGVKLMGDDFIGYKFIEKNSLFWNSLLKEKYDTGHEVGNQLNSKWFNEHDISFEEYDSDVWKLY